MATSLKFRNGIKLEGVTHADYRIRVSKDVNGLGALNPSLPGTKYYTWDQATSYTRTVLSEEGLTVALTKRKTSEFKKNCDVAQEDYTNLRLHY